MKWFLKEIVSFAALVAALSLSLSFLFSLFPFDVHVLLGLLAKAIGVTLAAIAINERLWRKL